MKLYYAPKTRANRPRWALEEIGVSYELVPVDLKKGEHKSEDYLKINPMGQLPAFSDNGIAMFESAAIVAYIADKYPQKKLAPSPQSPERALYYQWMFFSMTVLDASVVGYFYHTQLYPEGKRIDAYAEQCRQDFQKAAKVLTSHLQNREFMVGNSFTAADIMIASNLSFAKALKLMDDFPTLIEYSKRQTSRPAFQRAIA